MMTRMVRRLALVMILVTPLACDDDELHYDQTCTVDADCKVAVSCCDGCFAINLTETLEACDSECVADACHTRFGAAAEGLEAHCSEGRCAARVIE